MICNNEKSKGHQRLQMQGSFFIDRALMHKSKEGYEGGAMVSVDRECEAYV